MRVADIAAAFHVSERTIQKLLKELETEKIIRRVPVYGASGVQKASKSGLSRTDFLIRTLTNKPVTVIANGGEILQELKRQGNNLNQAVRNCYFYPDEKGKVLSAVAECKRAYRALLFVLGEN